MDKLAAVETTVKGLYHEKHHYRADWADWILDHHVFVVADNASALAKQYGGNEVLARTAALLHDIADTQMKRSDEKHEEISLKMAGQIMIENGFTDEEIILVVEDAIHFHSCHGEQRPSTLEGKILSTADAMAHLTTDFYVFATWALGREKTLDEVKRWTLEKIERDFTKKIFFDDIRQTVKPDYDRIKTLFSK